MSLPHLEQKAMQKLIKSTKKKFILTQMENIMLIMKICFSYSMFSY